MRTSALYIITVAVFAAFGTTPTLAGFVDSVAIESSQAGLNLREGAYITPLSSVNNISIQKDMQVRRERCQNYQPVLRHLKVSFLFKDSPNLEQAMQSAGLPEMCLVEVLEWDNSDNYFMALLTPKGDVLIGYNQHQAYTLWSEVNHKKARLDAIALDSEGMTIVGIAPKGHVPEIITSSVGHGPKVEVYWPTPILPLQAPLPTFIER